MKKRILALATAFAMCVSLMAITVSAATPSLAGTLSNGKLTVSATGLDSGTAQVEFLATNKSDATDYRLDTANVSNGTATITFTVAGSDYVVNATPKGSDGTDQAALAPIEVQATATTSIGAAYSAHVQNIGWQTVVNDGNEAGTTGKSLRLEALKVNLTGNVPAGAKITYQAHVQNIGWQTSVSNGAIAGTVGKSLRLEALKITLNGMPGYEVKYRAHVQNIGWQDWQTTQNDTAIASASIAGTTGRSLRIEAVEIEVVETPS